MNNEYYSDVFKICYLDTEHQKNIFLATLDTLGLSADNFIFIKKHSMPLPEHFNAYTIYSKDRKYSFYEARKLIQEVRLLIKKITQGRKFEIWLANNDSPIGQVIIHHANCKDIFLLEDGLGNYVKGVFFGFDLGLKSILARCRNIIYLFPWYRSFTVLSCYMKPTRAFCLGINAFPLLRNEKKIVINATSFQKVVKESIKETVGRNKISLKKGDLVYIDQSVIVDEGHLGEAEYQKIIVDFLLTIINQNEFTCETAYIKRHPRANREIYYNLLAYIQKNLAVKVISIEENMSFEQWFSREKSIEVSVAAVCSSALYTAKIINPLTQSFCLDSNLLRRKYSATSKYIVKLKKMGVTVIQTN